MVGILSANTNGAERLFGTPPNFLYDDIRVNAAEKYFVKKEEIDAQYQERAAGIEAESDRYINVKAQVNNAAIAVENGQESIERVRNILLELRTSVALAGEEGEDTELRATEFDTKITTINNEADRIGKAFNLVGEINRIDYSPNQIEYRSDLGIRTTTLTGTYIGGDYRIHSDDGTVWIPELGTDLIEQFKALQGDQTKTTTVGGEKISTAASTRNALSLVSYDQETGNIVVDITVDPDASPVTVSGTMERAGIEIMQSWFYEGLTTEEGRNKAFEAIEKADALLTLAEGKLAVANAQVQKDIARVDGEIDRLVREKNGVLVEQLVETSELQLESQQQLEAMMRNLDNLSRQQQLYVDAFASFIRNPFTLEFIT